MEKSQKILKEVVSVLRGKKRMAGLAMKDSGAEVDYEMEMPEEGKLRDGYVLHPLYQEYRRVRLVELKKYMNILVAEDFMISHMGLLTHTLAYKSKLKTKMITYSPKRAPLKITTPGVTQ